MLKIFKRNRGNYISAWFESKSKPATVIYWTNCDIPAKLFFDIMHTGDYSKLGTDTPVKLEAAFDAIFDEYNNLDSNPKITQWFDKQIKIKLLRAKINAIDTCLHHIAYSSLTRDERIEAINILNSIEGVKINFSLDKPLLDEILRVKNSVVGLLNNQLNIELSTEKKQAENIKYEFTEDLVAVENMLERQVDENVSLRKFVFLKKSAQERAEKLLKTQRKNGK